jgi:hypothetical protein
VNEYGPDITGGQVFFVFKINDVLRRLDGRRRDWTLVDFGEKSGRLGFVISRSAVRVRVGAPFFPLKPASYHCTLLGRELSCRYRKHTGSNRTDRLTVASLHYAIRPNRHPNLASHVDPDSRVTHLFDQTNRSKPFKQRVPTV